MGYLHIPNLYKSNQEILQFKQVYTLEKIDGTSAHLLWKDGKIIPFSGGASHENFVQLFDMTALTAFFLEKIGIEKTVCIYGEAYGGKVQAMSQTYGKELKFVAFDVQINGTWLNVRGAEAFVKGTGLEFVDYALVDTTLENLDKERDRESTQAIRNGCGNGHKREGIVIRPPFEIALSSGERLIVKHKRADFKPERKNTPLVTDMEKLKIFEAASEAAEEFVTPGRLEHVLDKIFINGETPKIERMGEVIKNMLEDVLREAAGELVDSKELRTAISKKTATLFKDRLAL